MSFKKMILVISIWGVIALLLAGVMIGAAFGLFDGTFEGMGDWFNQEGDQVEILNRNEAGGDVREVEVRWSTGAVTISRSEDDRASIRQTSKYAKKEAEVSLESGKLYIKQKWEPFFLFFRTKRSDLELRLPDKAYDAFMMKLSSGSADIRDVAAGSLTLDISSGKITASALSSTGGASIKISSGSITVDALKVEQELDIRIASGSLKLSSVTAQTLDCDISSGSAVIGQSAIRGKATIDMSSGKLDASGGMDAGELDVGLSSGKTTLSGAYGSITRAKTSSGTLKITSSVTPDALAANLSSGSITITIPGDKEFALDYKKSSGSVKVEGFNPLREIDDAYVFGNSMEPALRYSVKLSSGTFRLSNGG